MNEEGIRKRIHALLDQIQTEADPVLLNRCRSIFRQEVSFFRRSYMAAYLLLLAEYGPSGGKTEKSPPRSGNRRDRNRGEEGRDKNRRWETEPAHILSDEESVKLFISIGRNRKVFPREILALVNTKAGIPRDDIGNIRILDNYSFIQVRTGAADTAIKALNGQTFRGRTLTVSYARNRREDEGEKSGRDVPAVDEDFGKASG